MNEIAVIKSENIEIIDSIKNKFDCDIVEDNDNLSKYKVVVLTGFCNSFNNFPSGVKVLNIHPSLLPSFAEADALKKSFLSGVKVSGITIHEVTKDKFFSKILAQYPVLIGLNTHYDEYTAEITACTKKLYPAVIDAVLNDRVFDFADLFKTSCHKTFCPGNCGSCTKQCQT